LFQRNGFIFVLDNVAEEVASSPTTTAIAPTAVEFWRPFCASKSFGLI
jgi:hypothetical protein